MPRLLLVIQQGAIQKPLDVSAVDLHADEHDLLAAVTDVRVPDALDPLDRCRIVWPLLSRIVAHQ